MTTMFINPFILVNVFFHLIFAFFLIKMVVIVYDLGIFGM